jgi:hypothetical protein
MMLWISQRSDLTGSANRVSTQQTPHGFVSGMTAIGRSPSLASPVDRARCLVDAATNSTTAASASRLGKGACMTIQPFEPPTGRRQSEFSGCPGCISLGA